MSDRSLLAENTHTSVAALGSHGGHDLPAVDDGVVALDAAQQGVPVVAEGEEAGLSSAAAWPPPAQGVSLPDQTPSPPPMRLGSHRSRCLV